MKSRPSAPRDGQHGPAPIDPLTMGISEARVLSSVIVRAPELGIDAASDPSGRFFLELEVPRGASRIVLTTTSNLLTPARGRARLHVALEPGPATADVEVDVAMVPAVTAQPQFAGEPITPEQLEHPEIRAEFLRQMAEVANLVMPPPGSWPSETTGTPGASAPGSELADAEPSQSPPGVDR